MKKFIDFSNELENINKDAIQKLNRVKAKLLEKERQCNKL
jgi:hypothetical protein